MRGIIQTFVGGVARAVRDADAALAAGSIRNARRGVQENRRRRALEHAVAATGTQPSHDSVAV